MAKAKKETAAKSSKDSSIKKPAAHKPAPAKAKAKPAGMGSSLIDTSLAAENAARHLVAGLNRKGSLNKPGGKSNPESSTFKQMKSGLNKHGSNAMDTLLDKTHGPNSTTTGGHGFEKKQVGHNQTVGSDAARANVPRRTAG